MAVFLQEAQIGAVTSQGQGGSTGLSIRIYIRIDKGGGSYLVAKGVILGFLLRPPALRLPRFFPPFLGFGLWEQGAGGGMGTFLPHSAC